MEYIKKFGHNFKREMKFIGIAVCLGVFITGIIATATKAYSDTIQSGIADSVIRFHVLANSDSSEDQALKLKVRDAVLTDMEAELKKIKHIEDSYTVLRDNMERIRETALSVIQENGYNYPIEVSLTNELFPMKQYGDVVFPAGMYDALRIQIGEAEGQNWWCVMFPPLCFVDASYGKVSDEGKDQLKHILTDEEYSVVVTSKTEEAFIPEVKLKIVEWWQERTAQSKKFAAKK